MPALLMSKTLRKQRHYYSSPPRAQGFTWFQFGIASWQKVGNHSRIRKSALLRIGSISQGPETEIHTIVL